MNHRRNGNGGNGGVPDWFYWALAFITLLFVLYFLVVYDWRVMP